MAGAAGAGPEQGSPIRTRGWRDWAGLPAVVLEKVAAKAVAQDEAAAEARLKRANPLMSEELIQRNMARRKRDGNCLFVFARVCREWR